MSLGNVFIPPSFSGSSLQPQHASLHTEFQKVFDKWINESCKCKGAQTVNYYRNSCPSGLGCVKLPGSSSGAPAPLIHTPPSHWAASVVCLQCIRGNGYQRVSTQEAAWGGSETLKYVAKRTVREKCLK